MQPETKEEAEQLAAQAFQELQGIDINKLERFFPGHYWVSEDPDLRRGLAMPAQDEREAVERFFSRELTWYNRGRSFTAYAQKDEKTPPVRVTVDW